MHNSYIVKTYSKTSLQDHPEINTKSFLRPQGIPLFYFLFQLHKKNNFV